MAMKQSALRTAHGQTDSKENNDTARDVKLLRRIQVEGLLPSLDHAEIALQLMDEGHAKNDVYSVIREDQPIDITRIMIDTIARVRKEEQLVVRKHVRRLLAEQRLQNPEQAELAAKLLIEDFDEAAAILAAQVCEDTDSATDYLKHNVPSDVRITNRNEEETNIEDQIDDVEAQKKPPAKKAALVLELLNMGVVENEAVIAAQYCTTAEEAMAFLASECEVCFEHFTPKKNCARTYFTIRIMDYLNLSVGCPVCQKPEVEEMKKTDYINHLENQLKPILSNDIMQVLENKILNMSLKDLPDFKWCRKCNNGFVVDPQDRKVSCNQCHYDFCAHCGKEWLPQHDGVSCEKFSEWYESDQIRNPEGPMSKFLQENGLRCPKCRELFELARGGCMHFKCPKCCFEFCSGCGNEFRKGTLCSFAEDCASKGLHAHHSRRCLYYLRDKFPEDLIKVLEDKGIDYGTKTANDPYQQDKNHGCTVNVQKEISDGPTKTLNDEECGENVDQLSSVMCRKHFIEYLVGLINTNLLDPITILDIGELEAELKRNKKHLPPKTDDPGKYRQDLIELILKEIPLSSK